MLNDLAPLAPFDDAAPIEAIPADVRDELLAELFADAPTPEPFTDEDIDAMYADWCARNGVDVDDSADGHKDHHYWAA